MNAVRVRVLLDTGPTDVEVRQIAGIFADAGLTATAEGHSYGGPPPTSAFLIVVNAPLAPLLDHFAALPEGAAVLARVTATLLEMRGDRDRWGRQHTVRLEDSHTDLAAALPAPLPQEAYRVLMNVDVSGFDRASPPMVLEWADRFGWWVGRLATAPIPVARRLPVRPDLADQDNGRIPGGSRVRQLDHDEVGELWRLVAGRATSVLTWQRARVVLLCAMGWNGGSIAKQTAMSEPRVRTIIANFNRHGFASLTPEYAGGEPVALTPTDEQEVRRVAALTPAAFGLPDAEWSPVSLAQFLVAEGIVEDVDPLSLRSLTSAQPGRIR